jgi:hypothetical protein
VALQLWEEALSKCRRRGGGISEVAKEGGCGRCKEGESGGVETRSGIPDPEVSFSPGEISSLSSTSSQQN